MLNIVATVCCIIYYALSSIMEIPSIVRVLKRKKSSDYSILAVIMNLVSTFAWSIYVYTSEQNIVVYIGTLSDLIICILYTIVMLKYHDDCSDESAE